MNDCDIHWREIKNELPIDSDIILYSIKKLFGLTQVGRYCGINDPMPSAPHYITWNQVTHWALVERPQTLEDEKNV